MRTLFFSAGALLASCATTPSPARPLEKAPKPAMTQTNEKTAPVKPDAARLLTLAPDEYRKSCDDAIASAEAEIAKLKALAPSKDPLPALEIFDRATAALSDASGTASVVRNSHPDPAMREAADACEQRLEKISTDLALDRGIYDALVALAARRAGRDDEEVDGEDAARLPPRRRGQGRARPATQVKALNDELVRIGQEFGKNIRDDVRTVELDPSDLDGLPEDYRARPPAGRERQGARSPPTTRTRPVHDLREEREGARGSSGGRTGSAATRRTWRCSRS